MEPIPSFLIGIFGFVCYVDFKCNWTLRLSLPDSDKFVPVVFVGRMFLEWTGCKIRLAVIIHISIFMQQDVHKCGWHTPFFQPCGYNLCLAGLSLDPVQLTDLRAGFCLPSCSSLMLYLCSSSSGIFFPCTEPHFVRVKLRLGVKQFVFCALLPGPFFYLLAAVFVCLVFCNLFLSWRCSNTNCCMCLYRYAHWRINKINFVHQSHVWIVTLFSTAVVCFSSLISAVWHHLILWSVM